MPRKSSTDVKKDLENLDTAEKKPTSRAKRTASKASAAKKDGAEKVVSKVTNSKKSTAKESRKLDSINSANLENAESKPKKASSTKVSKARSSSTKTTKTTAKSTNKKTTKTSATKKNTTKASGTKSLASKSKQSTIKSKKRSTSKTKKVAEKVLLPDDITSSTDLTKKIEVIEYYDLPYRYNQTVVKVLAQTPNTLFIYWDISDEDRKIYEKEYGSNFFEKTRPYLIITNKTKNYTFEVEINDFANSWYLHVNDADCDYQVELGRKFIENSVASAEETASYSANDYLPITSSNDIEMPNNHILFDKLGKSIFFRNTKTNIVTKKDISSISFMQNIGKVYNIYDLYKEIYKDEFAGNNILELDFPSSNSSSNTFKEDTYNG